MPRPVSNPPNPWSTTHLSWLGEPPHAELEVFEEEARSVLTENESPDISFRYSVNPYRGCLHGCAYCYARPTHQYLGFGAGTDFDRKIVVKVNAPEALVRDLAKPSFAGGTIAFSGNTDCYQPLEASYGLTRRCLEVCRDSGNTVGVITKGMLVRRDLDILAEMAGRGLASVFVSIPFADDLTARKIEPYASRPSQRFETLRLLSAAGIPAGIAVAPVIPGLNDRDIPALLEEARAAGARSAFMVLLRLPAEVLPVFEERLREEFPLRAEKVLNGIRDVRGGKLNESRFGARMQGTGPRWEAIERLFDLHVNRLGLNRERRRDPAPARCQVRQATLFDDLSGGSNQGG
jgi:DNA repair photolyase